MLYKSVGNEGENQDKKSPMAMDKGIGGLLTALGACMPLKHAGHAGCAWFTNQNARKAQHRQVVKSKPSPFHPNLENQPCLPPQLPTPPQTTMAKAVHSTMIDDNGEIVHVHHYYQYCPPGVKHVLSSGTSAWIGEVDDSTVFKYPKDPEQEAERISAEKRIMEAIPPHKHVIGFKGAEGDGIYLERATNGTVAEHIREGKPLSLQQRLAWCRETAEAIAWIHAHRVIHCDIQPTNLLLDKDLHVKLSDFQGRLLAEEGTELVDGCSMEPYRFSLPRDDFHADVKTDLFALGSTIYFILLGHIIFRDVDVRAPDASDVVEERLRKKEWPREQHACSAVSVRCWEQQYGSAEEVVRDLEEIERSQAQPPAESLPLSDIKGALGLQESPVDGSQQD